MSSDPRRPAPAGEAADGRSSLTADRLAYVAYDVLGAVLSLAALPVLPLLCLTRHGRGLTERLGRVPPTARTLAQPIWVHAASVGEVLAAEPLIQQLQTQRPDLAIVVSTTSLTGRETARTRLGVDATMLLPLDVGWIVGRVMRRLQPRGLVLLETEIWPALLRAAAHNDVPSMIVSGRVSERGARRYRWIRWLMRAVLKPVGLFAMQSEADAARVIALGAPPDRVQVIGSLKFARESSATATATATSAALALFNQRPVLIAASTHPGEEQMVLDACAGLWPEHPALLVVIAPRRPERFDDVARLLAGAGLRHQQRSRLDGPVAAATQVLLLDTLGDLPNLLPAARAVFVGGTIAPVEGHNVLEPALFSKPVAFGPHTANVAAAADALLDAGAATRVHDAETLRAEWRRLLAHPDVAQQAGARGRAIVAARAAVAPRTAELVLQMLDTAPAGASVQRCQR